VGPEVAPELELLAERLMRILLEELPLKDLRPLVAVGRDVLGAVAEVPEDGVRLAQRTTIV